MMLSLAAYSFRPFFDQMRGKPSKLPAEEQITMLDFIDYCAEQGFDGAELTSYFLPPDLDQAAGIELKRRAFLRGIEVSGTAVGNNFTHPAGEERDAQMAYVKHWIDRSVDMGAPHIRVFAGKHGKDLPEDKAWANVVENLREAGDYAGQRGIFLGIENHDSVGDHETLLQLVKDADHPWVGVNLDTGNFRTEDPYVDMEKTAPYTVNVQVKVELKRLGSDVKEETDLKRVADILRAANYQGYVVLEYEAKENPYEAVPPLLEEMREIFG